MAYSQGCDFLFCNYCGTMLSMESKFVTCTLCKFKRNAKEVVGKEISYMATAEDVRRELGQSLFDTEGDNKVQWSKVKKTCEKCKNPEMHYSTRQDVRRELGQSLFDTEGDNKVQWSKTCEKCKNPEMCTIQPDK